MDTPSEAECCLISGRNPNKPPRFSIIIPTYGCAPFLPQALESALGQERFNDFEIVVVENGYSEGSVSIAEVVRSASDGRVRHYRNRENIGMYGNWNRAVVLSKADYVVMLHDDDLIHPSALFVLDRFLCEHPTCKCVGLQNQWFKSRKPYVFEDFPLPEAIPCKKVNVRSIYYGRNIKIAGMTFSKEAFESVGGFRPTNGYASDTAFIARIAHLGDVAEIMLPLAAYRVAQNTSSSREGIVSLVKGIMDLRQEIAPLHFDTFMHRVLFKDNYDAIYALGAIKTWLKEEEPELILDELGVVGEGANNLRGNVCKLWVKTYLGYTNLRGH